MNSNEYYYKDSASKKTLYSDIDIRFSSHPMTGDIMVLKEVDAVMAALRNLVLTKPGEKAFDPSFGVDVNGLLFESVSMNPSDLEDRIIAAINKHEKRVKVQRVYYTESPEDNAVALSIAFSIVNLTDLFTIDVTLRRTK